MLAITTPIFSNAQISEVERSNTEYQDQIYTSFEVDYPANTVQLKGYWKDFIENSYEADVKGYGFLTNKEIFRIEEARFPTISKNPLDLFARFTPTIKDSSRIEVFAEQENEIPINRYLAPATYHGLKKLVGSFTAYANDRYYEETLNEIAEKMAALEKDKEKALKEQMKAKDEVRDYKLEIRELEVQKQVLEKSMAEG